MKKNTSSTIILILVFLVGLSLLLYPSISNYWNSFHSSRAISRYAEEVAGMNSDRYAQLWEEARRYNDSLNQNPNRFMPTEEERTEYQNLLHISEDGVLGYVEIPKVGCSLPIYHGTMDSVLQNGAGHIEGSSLPTGDLGTHCAISGHRGLPSARLFTDLDQLVTGDKFMLRILDKTLTYEVDQILIVLPYQLDGLKLDPEQDYCTLVTCTPYGVNSHRILIRGHRVETEDAQAVQVVADAMKLAPVIVAPLVAVPMLLLLLIALLLTTRRKKK